MAPSFFFFFFQVLTEDIVALNKCHPGSFRLGVKKKKNGTVILTALFLKRLFCFKHLKRFVITSIVYHIIYSKTSHIFTIKQTQEYEKLSQKAVL